MILGRIGKRARIRAALCAATVYALCVLAPNVALAFTNAKGALHCLTEPSNLSHVHAAQKAETHAHADGSSHVHAAANGAAASHDDGNSDHGKPGKVKETNCCGLFCVTAIAHEGVAVLPAPPPNGFGPLMPEPAGVALAPLRIYEPPIG
jgi:hypothetical protein